jgi:hypothetical protein
MSLNDKQISYVKQIIGSVDAQKLPKTAAIAAIATALVESNLQNYANRNVPASMSIPHDAVGTDHASLGIYQQQTGYNWTKYSSMGSPDGWGKPASLMDIVQSTHKFLTKLTSFDWQSMSIGDACQRVQGSAFPDRYAQRVSEATDIVNQYGDDMTPAELNVELDKRFKGKDGKPWPIENLVYEAMKPFIEEFRADLAEIKQALKIQ